MQPSDEHPQDWQQPSEQSTDMPPEVFAPRDVPPEELLSEGQTGAEPATDELSDDSSAQNYEGVEEADTDDEVLLRWQATEYVQHDRTIIWYLVFGIVVAALVALAILVFRSWTFAILVPVMAVALIIYVKRPASINDYTLSRTGLHINERLSPYSQFKSFGVVSHNGVHSIVLVPRKRFQISQTLYFPEEVGEPLVDMLAARLPMKELTPDLVDRMLSRLRL